MCPPPHGSNRARTTRAVLLNADEVIVYAISAPIMRRSEKKSTFSGQGDTHFGFCQFKLLNSTLKYTDI
jgi:hypothetical protein